MSEVTNKEVICSFCGKNNNDVHLIIAGLTGNICNKCVEISVEIVQEKRPGLLGEKADTVAQLANLNHLLKQAARAIGVIVSEEKKKIQPLENVLGDIQKAINQIETEDSESS
jgi:ATP-dependent Clp protease ATP-binding subunit ClpX